MTNIRTVMGSMDLDELLSNRDTINARLLQVVDAATEPWGVKVTRIEIKDIAPPRDLVDSMARQMKAEREKRAQILEAEGLAGSRAILKAEGEKQAVVLAAEGRKEAAFRDAEARERFAQAEAKATRMVCEAIAKGNVQAINYFVANNYMKALEAIAKSPNQKILMMPLEASSVIGSLAGIAEITSEAFGRNGAAAPTPPPRAGAARGSVPHGLSSELSRFERARRSKCTCRRCSTSSRLRPLELVHRGRRAVHSRDDRSGRAFPVVRARRRHRRQLALATGIGWPWQLVAFGVISVLTVFWVRRFYRVEAAQSDLPDLNIRGQQYVGRSLMVEHAIQNGRGKVRVGDYAVGRRGPGRAGRHPGHRHGGQGNRAGGGACSDLTTGRAHSPGSSPS